MFPDEFTLPNGGGGHVRDVLPWGFSALLLYHGLYIGEMNLRHKKYSEIR